MAVGVGRLYTHHPTIFLLTHRAPAAILSIVHAHAAIFSPSQPMVCSGPVEKNLEAIATAIQEFLGANRDPMAPPRHHREVRSRTINHKSVQQ